MYWEINGRKYANIFDGIVDYLKWNPTHRIYIPMISKNFFYLSMKYSEYSILNKPSIKNVQTCLKDKECVNYAKHIKRTIKQTSNRRTFIVYTDDEIYIVRRIRGVTYVETYEYFGNVTEKIPVTLSTNRIIIPYASESIIDKVPEKVRVENLIAMGKPLYDNVKIEPNIDINKIFDHEHISDVYINIRGRKYVLTFEEVFYGKQRYYPILTIL